YVVFVISDFLDFFFFYYMFFFFFFFFSSRRRHTRSYGDWSSNVCSSDLACDRRDPLHRAGAGARRDPVPPISQRGRRSPGRVARSEERRVGKECRCRWGAEHEKKKREERE